MSARTVHVFSLIPNLTRLLVNRCSELNFKEIPVPKKQSFDLEGELFWHITNIYVWAEKCLSLLFDLLVSTKLERGETLGNFTWGLCHDS